MAALYIFKPIRQITVEVKYSPLLRPITLPLLYKSGRSQTQAVLSSRPVAYAGGGEHAAFCSFLFFFNFRSVWADVLTLNIIEDLINLHEKNIIQHYNYTMLAFSHKSQHIQNLQLIYNIYNILK
jgi:hypothetical protein